MQDHSDAVLERARDQRGRVLGGVLRTMRRDARRSADLRGVLLVLAVLGGMLLYTRELASFGGSPLVMLTVLAAAIVSSIAGFAFSALCGAVLVHLVRSPVAIVQIMLVCSIGIQCLCVWSLRRDIDWARLSTLLAGGLVGLPGGLWVLLHLDHREYTHVLGGLLLLYAAWMLLRSAELRLPWIGRFGAAAGFIGGLTGGMAALPGPIVTIWCGLQGWGKARQRAVTQPFILIMQITSLLALRGFGGTAAAEGGSGLLAWAYLPAALLGALLGLALFRRLSDRQFAATVNLLLLVSGLGLLT